MSSLFPRWTNAIPTAAALAVSFGGVGVVVGGWYYLTPDYFEVGYSPTQPVNYSHHIHAGKLGIDCRYCHTHVTDSYTSNVPATGTCMNCHTGDESGAYLNAELWKSHKENPNLIKVRESYASGTPIEWRRVHKLPDYVQFPHAAHINAGVSCYSCHGRIDQQAVVRQEKGLGMGWCLDCHRAPEKNLVDVDGLLPGATASVKPTDLASVAALLADGGQHDRGAKLAELRQLEPPQHCGACHY